LVIPSMFRDELKESFVITRGIEHCLYVYSMDKWNELVSKLDTLPFTKKDARTFIRSFFSGANMCSFDHQGRIVITEPQKNYALLDKACVILGVNDRIEIWSEEEYSKYTSDNSEKLESIAEHLFED
jgi:MraZ protein